MDSAKSSDIDSYVDGHCLVVPEELAQEAKARLPEGWGMLFWPSNPEKREYTVEGKMWPVYEVPYDGHRARILSMALLRLAQWTSWNR